MRPKTAATVSRTKQPAEKRNVSPQRCCVFADPELVDTLLASPDPEFGDAVLLGGVTTARFSPSPATPLVLLLLGFDTARGRFDTGFCAAPSVAAAIAPLPVTAPSLTSLSCASKFFRSVFSLRCERGVSYMRDDRGGRLEFGQVWKKESARKTFLVRRGRQMGGSCRGDHPPSSVVRNKQCVTSGNVGTRTERFGARERKRDYAKNEESFGIRMQAKKASLNSESPHTPSLVPVARAFQFTHLGRTPIPVSTVPALEFEDDSLAVRILHLHGFLQLSHQLVFLGLPHGFDIWTSQPN